MVKEELLFTVFENTFRSSVETLVQQFLLCFKIIIISKHGANA